MNNASPLTRFPLLGLVIVLIVLGMWAALARIGWELPTPTEIQGIHGALMIGF